MSVENTRCICGICTKRCTIDCTVEDGKLKSIKPIQEDGFKGCNAVCLRGFAAAGYEYRADRIVHPLRRIGERGEGKFEEISWDEAIYEVAKRLLKIREEHGADSVSFYSGYSKWYRPMLRRFCTDFGSVNYATESSTCHRAKVIAQFCDHGYKTEPDCKNAGVILTFARARFSKPMKDAHERGAKIIAVDCRTSPDIRKYADLHLRPRPGTDLALAHAISKLLIDNGKADMDFIEKHVHGFDEYNRYISRFTPEKAQELTGIDAQDIIAAATMIGDNLPFAIYDGFSGTIHHRNGVQTFRAWDALNAVTGCFGRSGGTVPSGTLQVDGEPSMIYRQLAFSHPRELDGHKISEKRIPLWAHLLDECHAAGYPEAAESGELKAIFALGLNARMFAGSRVFFDMLKKLDFFVDCDMWMSDTAKYADIVLPVCTTYERDQIALVGMNKKLWYSGHVIEPLGECRSDEDIMCDLVRAMDLDDELMKSGKEACWRWQLEGTGITLEELKASGKPYTMPPAEPKPDPLANGFPTPSGKFELWSELLAEYTFQSPIPTYADPMEGQNTAMLPMVLQAGVRTDRYAHAVHSRIHTVPELRRRRPEPAVDITSADAEKYGLQKGDRVRLVTASGYIEVNVDIDDDLLPGTCNMFHGYSEADVNTLFPAGFLDPISNFPGFKAIACRLVKI